MVTKKKTVGFYLQDLGSKYYKYDNSELFMELDLTDENERPLVVEKIIKNNIGLALHILSKFSANYRYGNKNRLTFDELFSSCMWGLLKAVETFQPEKGIKFATYSSRIIMNEILMDIRRSKSMGITSSADASVSDDGEGNEITIMDLLHYQEDGYDDLSMTEMTLDLVRKAEEILTPRQLEVLRLKMAGGTQYTISKQLSISQSYVSRIHSKCLEKLRPHYNAYDKR